MAGVAVVAGVDATAALGALGGGGAPPLAATTCCSGGRMCSTKGLLSLASIVFILPWFNDASIASVAANLFRLATTSLSCRDSACLALAMLAACSFAVVRVVSILIGLRPSLALRGDGGGESSMRTMTGSRSAGTS